MTMSSHIASSRKKSQCVHANEKNRARKSVAVFQNKHQQENQCTNTSQKEQICSLRVPSFLAFVFRLNIVHNSNVR